METVLVIGATGNIGTAAVKGALNAGYKVLAIVRNSASASKLFKNLGTEEGVTTVEADILSEKGVLSVVDKVKAGKLPDFQHVYATAGGTYSATPLKGIDGYEIRDAMKINFEPNLYAYTATVPYLLEQKHPNSSWTLCTGSQGEEGYRAVPALTQGALFSLAVCGCRELHGTNIRFNEVFLSFRVEVDQEAEKSGVMKASEFAHNYETLLGQANVKGCRVSVDSPKDVTTLKYVPKLNLDEGRRVLLGGAENTLE